MILPVILLFLCGTWTVSSLEEGEACNFADGGSGICTILNNCQSVYQDLMADKPPAKICGYIGYDPVVCCPSNTPKPVVTTAAPTVDLVGDGRGAIAKRKCAEYAKFVYVKKYVPTLVGNKQQISISQCAIKTQKLIVGGTKAERMEFPHMTAIGYNMEDGSVGWLCGGTLISETYVLTAAHCTYAPGLGPATRVRVGDLNLVRTDDGATPVERLIAERIRYPQYKPPSKYHDIALLRLESSVTFTGWIRPACLQTAPDTGTQKAIATGWGRVNWIEEEGSNDLLKVTLPLVSQENCRKSYPPGPANIQLLDGVIQEWAICAGKLGNDTCQGDSGGPLVIFGKSEYCMYDLVGITSIGKLCGMGTPGIYTRVYHYVSWIEGIVWPRG